MIKWFLAMLSFLHLCLNYWLRSEGVPVDKHGIFIICAVVFATGWLVTMHIDKRLGK